MIDKQAALSSIDSCNKSLENYIKNIRKLTTEIPRSEQNNTILQKELDICTEQEFRIIEIRSAMSPYIENKIVSALNLYKKEHLQTISFENTLNLNSPPNVNRSTKFGKIESLPVSKSKHKSKPDSNRSPSSSSKAFSRLSSNSLTSSYGRGTCFSFIKKRKTIEQAKLLALQVEETFIKIARA